MKLRTGLKEALGQFGPLAALAVALAVFVALVPSVRPGSETPNFDPLATSGPNELEPAVATGGPSTVGAVTATGAPRGRVQPDSPAVENPSLFKGEDCHRRIALGRDASCRPIWSGGDNGGATSRGVTADKIRIVVYAPNGNPQVEAALANLDIPSYDQIDRALKAFQKYFNKNFELFGRSLEIVHQKGPGDGASAAQQQADAIYMAEELKAFAVVAASAHPALHDELSRRHVLNFSGILPLSSKYLAQRAPYTLMALPETDLLWSHFAEYYCKRLVRQPAEHAGPLLAGTERKLGIVYAETDFARFGEDLAALVKKRCGVVAKVVSYPGDITRAAQLATNAIAQMRDAGVTSVTCVCDPLFPVFLTGEATRQGYFPEWLMSGFWATDSPVTARIYDQQQWAHAFGISGITYPIPLSETPNWNSYWEIMGAQGNYDDAIAGDLDFFMLRTILEAIERSGPRIAARGVLEALFHQPVARTVPLPQAGYSTQTSFGGGTLARPGAYSALDNFFEVWWDPNRTGNDNKRGAMFYVNGGKRHLEGQWPKTVPRVFVDDGTRQPAIDPQRQCRCHQAGS